MTDLSGFKDIRRVYNLRKRNSIEVSAAPNNEMTFSDEPLTDEHIVIAHETVASQSGFSGDVWIYGVPRKYEYRHIVGFPDTTDDTASLQNKMVPYAGDGFEFVNSYVLETSSVILVAVLRREIE